MLVQPHLDYHSGSPPPLSFFTNIRHLLALQLVLLDRICHLQQVLLLLHVRALQTSGHTGAGVTAGIHHVSAVVVLSLVEKGLNAWLGEAPGPSVERLFLTPNNVLGVGVRVEVLLKLGPWEGVELLYAGNGRVGELVGSTVLVKCCVDLSCAEDDTLNLVVGLKLELAIAIVRWVWDDPLEVAFAGEVFN